MTVFDPNAYELGEDVTDTVEKSKKAGGMVVSVRLSRDEADRLVEYAEQNDRTVSQVARLALRQFLNDIREPMVALSTASVAGTASMVVHLYAPAVYTAGDPCRFKYAEEEISDSEIVLPFLVGDSTSRARRVGRSLGVVQGLAGSHAPARP